MVQEKKLIQTGVVSMVFLFVLLLVGFLEQNVFSGVFTNPTLVGVALVPILVFLAVTGRLQRFSGGGFEIVLQEQARKFVSPDVSEDVEFDSEKVRDKRPTSELEDIKEGAPTALAFELEREEFYTRGAIEVFLETLKTLRYVVFTDSDGRFEGYAPVDIFSQLLENPEVNVVDEIETGEITDRAIVRRDAIGSDTTNRECLREMDDRDVSELAVVDSEETFVGVITQDAIIRRVISSALSEG